MDSDIRWHKTELITNYNNSTKKIKDKYKRYPVPQRHRDKPENI